LFRFFGLKFTALTVLLSVNFIAYANNISVLAVEYPPFTTANEESGGAAFVLLRQRTAHTNINWLPEIVPPARAYQRIAQSEWCASFYPAFGEDNYTRLALSTEPIDIGLVREASEDPFSWPSLDELQGKSIALLRTGSESEFVQQFTEAGMELIFVENIDAATKMVLLGRSDFAMMDSVTFANLDEQSAKQLQMSSKFLLSTPITLFVHSSCYRVLKQAFPKL